MSLRDIEAYVTVLHDAIVHEAEDDFSAAAGGAAVRLLGNFFADIHRIADALEASLPQTTFTRQI